jgi:uncharacterized membrane protein
VSIYRNLYTGLGAGAVAAIVAILVSLPLESPDDIVFNAASVGFASIVVGAATGLIWHLTNSVGLLDSRYLIGSGALLAVVVAVAVGAQTQFEDAAIFTIPLGLIAATVSIVATPFASNNQRIGIWMNGLLVIIAVGMSLALAGQGDQESGSLSLPPPP